MKQILCVMLLVFVLFPIRAGDITGRIVDRKGKPIKNILVKVKNTSNTTKSLKDGIFLLKSVSESDTLQISPSKNKKVYIPVKDNYAFDIILGKESLSLNRLSGEEFFDYLKTLPVRNNSNVLTREEIEESSANSLIDLLRGNIPGVQVTEIDNVPIAKIRGGSSMSLSVEPLYIVDNVEYNSLVNVNSSVNIKDIESVEVLKDASMYGLKGANGVIVIKTKIN
ncbi:TonB-dependent receptor plug domain-containing protein [Dysgonomonas sp. HGC4]|uniref:TonB-dependent receptor plug domain-containing protein n=1 Tax=Dysgonomonas sp. HGC4 TaxID=1658009 RepID=UPI0009E40CB5|nr:TonB-dependent receptor plug domain-containing protein [Dysgonomonas sp. HGC4]MBD8347569.1 TonB-dependent receptor plug domain-containing protein [Dysgonomonas sp. HGC4]